MAKKKKKKFQKTQLISLFENKNYQKVISKIKQFEIDGMSTDELQTILTTSYIELAQSNFIQGDIARAIRDIDSLLQIDNDIKFRVIKLKYLCYIENFVSAIELGEELILLNKAKKIQKEAIFLYLMANHYSGNYELDKKLLKAIPVSRQKYVLGFSKFLQGEKELALRYFEESNPRAKDEKKSLEAIKAIISDVEIDCGEDIKPLYRFLITGESEGLANTKNSRAIKKELTAQFSKGKKSSAIKNLLALKSSVGVDVIVENAKSKEQEKRLIYNNIVLLVEKHQYDKALSMFIKYRNYLVEFIESSILFISIKNQTENRKSDRILIHFFSNYFKLHHKKIAPFHAEYIFLFLIQRTDMTQAFKLAREYGGEDIAFLLDELPLADEFKEHHQDSFDKIVKSYSSLKEQVLITVATSFEGADNKFDTFTDAGKKAFLNRLFIVLRLLKNLKRPHKKYREAIFKLLQNLSLVTQNFKFIHEEALYLQLADGIEHYIDYYGVDRGDLAIDIKALFVSISRGESVKKGHRSRKDEPLMAMAMRIFMEDDESDDIYDFDEWEYDLSSVKQRFIEALKQKRDPFSVSLGDFSSYNDADIIYGLIFELIAKAREYGVYNNKFIDRLLISMNISTEDKFFRNSIVSRVNDYAVEDVEVARLFLDHALTYTSSSEREYMWYLKWLEGYILLVEEFSLPKDDSFKGALHHFVNVQYKKKFKTLNKNFNRIIDKFMIKREGVYHFD